MTNVTLTTEQAQQIEEALEDIVRVFKFETGTPVEALATIRAARAQEQAEQEPEEQLSELGYAARLARELCKKHYPDCSKNWKPLDSLYGVLTQIDNMVSGLIRNTQSVQEPVAWAHPSGGYLSARYMKEFATGLEKETYTIPLYAAPVRTKDLTDEELNEVIETWATAYMNLNPDTAPDPDIYVARAIIATYKEKNK